MSGSTGAASAGPGSTDRKVALVTGASRGIGQATAVSLAHRGYDLVVTARSVEPGAPFAGTRRNDPETGMVMAGSLVETAQRCEAAGARVGLVALDLADRRSTLATADAAWAAFGRIDVVVDNAIAQIPGLNDPALHVELDALDLVMAGTALNPFALFQRLLPHLLEHDDAVFVHVTSGAATLDPRGPGTWGIGYAMAKAAAHKVVGVLHAEHGVSGLRCYNLNPGHVLTEVGRARAQRAGRQPTGQSPEIPAAAIAWLADGSPAARELAGREVVAAQVVEQYGLLSG